MSTLITDEAREWVGRQFDLGEAILTADRVLKYAVGSDHALLGDLVGAGSEPARKTHISPLILRAMFAPVVRRQRLSSDGRPPVSVPPIGDGRAMAGEVSIELYHPLTVGMRLTATKVLDALNEKQGSEREFVVAHWQTTYVLDSGSVIATELYKQILM